MRLNWRMKKFFLSLLKDLEEYFQSSSIIAEMGAGSASFSIFFSGIYPDKKFILVDKSLEIIKKSKYKNRFELKEEDALSTSINDSSVDMIVSFGFLHHLSFPEVEKFLKEACRINKKFLLVIDRNKDIIEPAIENYLLLHEFEGEIDKEKGKKPESSYSLKEIKKLYDKNNYLCIFNKTYLETAYKLNKNEIRKYLSHISHQLEDLPFKKKRHLLKKFDEIKEKVLNKEVKIPPYFCLLGKKI